MEKRNLSAQELNKITTMAENGDILKALKRLTKLYKKNPNSNIIKLELAKLLVATNKNREKATKYYNQLLKTSAYSFAMLELGKLEFNYWNMEKATNNFKKILNKKSSNLAKLYLGKIAGLDGNYTEAKEIFESILDNENNKLLDEDLIKTRAIFELLQLSTSYEKYEEALYYLTKLTKIVGITRDTIQYKFYLEYKLGLLKNINNVGYFCEQILCYSNEKAIEHIKLRHGQVADEYINNFSPNIVIDELFKIVQSNLENLKKRDYGKCDKYLLNLGYVVGKYNGIETSVIKIITIGNTYDIITMYPTNEYCDEFPKEKIKIK